MVDERKGKAKEEKCGCAGTVGFRGGHPTWERLAPGMGGKGRQAWRHSAAFLSGLLSTERISLSKVNERWVGVGGRERVSRHSR